MLGDLKAQRRQIEHLPALGHRRFPQGALARVAVGRGQMHDDSIRLFYLLERVSSMPRLSAIRVLPRFAQRTGLGRQLGQPIRGRWFARIVAILGPSTFQFLHLRLQLLHFSPQLPHQRT